MGIFGGGGAQDDVDLRDLKDRVARLEATVASLQAQLAGTSPGAASTPVDSGWLQEVRALKQNGKLIQAIKVYREHTGLGLKESKDAVEGML